MCTLFEQHVPFYQPYQNPSCYQDLGNQFYWWNIQLFLICKCFFSSQLCLVASYLSWISSTLLIVIQKCVHKLIFRISVSYQNWYSMYILKSLDVIDCRFPSFMCDLLKGPVISTFISKSHVCTVAKYSCHRCVYLLVVVIFSVVSCKITFFNKISGSE